MDPTVRLDGARPANTCIQPSFPRNVPVQQCSLLKPPKIHLQVIKISKFNDITFLIKKFNEIVWQTRLWLQ